MNAPLSRRRWLESVAFLAGAFPLACGNGKEPGSGVTSDGNNIYFGDIHNHNSVGYAVGGLERSYDIAESHLDFFAFTPHSWWPDVPEMEQDKHLKWLKGFAETERRWPEVQALNESRQRDGGFVVLHAYEWHSSEFGDFCIYFPGGDSELRHFNTPEELKDFARTHGALLIPHHPAYLRGHRGANPEVWDPELTPVMEIYSEHGNAESDEGPFDYIRHSMGGRWRPNTYRAVLESGRRVGALASTDDHLGYPGAYGEGLAAVLAPELTRSAVFEALRRRRCYGVTGDRIELRFSLNGNPMGEELEWKREREISVDVRGWGEIDRIEVLKNGRVIHRDHPVDRPAGPDPLASPVLLRLEFGWGPWADLSIPRIADWLIDLEVSGGKILDWQPCFQSGPPDQERRNLVQAMGGDSLRVQSYTSRLKAFAEIPTNAVVLAIAPERGGGVSLRLKQPSEITVEKDFDSLLHADDITFTGPFPDESLILHRLVPENRFRSSFSFTDKGDGSSADCYYVRVLQTNGQMAWSSPVWVDRRA